MSRGAAQRQRWLSDSYYLIPQDSATAQSVYVAFHTGIHQPQQGPCQPAYEVSDDSKYTDMDDGSIAELRLNSRKGYTRTRFDMYNIKGETPSSHINIDIFLMSQQWNVCSKSAVDQALGSALGLGGLWHRDGHRLKTPKADTNPKTSTSKYRTTRSVTSGHS